MKEPKQTTRGHFWRGLIRFIGLLVPRWLRADWRQEWEAELDCRERRLAEWERLDWRNKLDLFRRSTSAFWDALWLLPKRMEDELMQDIRFGWRVLRQRRGFTLVAALSLALGIGANTAIFSVVDSILLRPLPYPGAARLVKLAAANFQQQVQWEHWNRAGVPLADFREWQAQSQSFEEMALYTGAGAYPTTVDDDSRYLLGSRVSMNLFAMLGTRAALGRLFVPADEQPDSPRVTVLSHQFWAERFQADPQILGKQLALKDETYTIVGVLPASFRDYFTQMPRDSGLQMAPLRVLNLPPTQFWLPLKVTHEAATWHGYGGNRHGSYSVLARLKPGVTQAQAQTELSAIAAQQAERYPESNKDLGATVVNLHAEVTGGTRGRLLSLVVAFALVLLIACANVASLLLARGIERAKELAIRATLGAGRWRLLRQLLTECLLLAGLGSALGLALAYALVAGLRPLIPVDIPRSDAITLDYRALLFTLGLSLLATLLAGLLPAWQAAKLNLTEELKEAGRSATESRRNRGWRHALVVSQVALTMILLTGAGLATKSFWRVAHQALGYDTANLARLRVLPPGPENRERYRRLLPDAQDAAEWQQYWQPLLAQVRALPGIADAAFTSGYPPEGVNFGATMRIPGHPPVKPRLGTAITGDVVSDDYFRLLGPRVLAGRSFNAADNFERPRVLVVNETFARTYFPHQATVGQTVTLNPGSKIEAQATIIGVVADTLGRLDRPLEPQVYQALTQLPLRDYNLLVRTTGPPEASFEALRKLARTFNSERPADQPVTLAEARTQLTVKPRFYLALLGSLALLALVLAVTGIYGTLWLTVNQRTHELGVRRALGAQDGDVLRLVLRQGAGLVLAGMLLGLLGAWGLTRFIRGWLVEVSPTDPLTFVAVALLLLLAALLACYAPARRAVRVDPLVALRSE
ncbi:MAG: ABC transporter permease [Acidobacteria bacterium]|nr:ABC transporter permease [Acidobacteriota bacterium]